MCADNFPNIFKDLPSDERSKIALEIYITERTFGLGLELILVRWCLIFHGWIFLFLSLDWLLRSD